MSTSDNTNNQMVLSPLFVKPIVSGISASLLNYYALDDRNVNNSVMFGAGVAGGVVVASVFTPYVPGLLPDTTAYSGKTINERIIEITFSSGIAYAVNKYAVQENRFDNSGFMKRIGVIIASEVIGEYMADYFSLQPLSYFV